MRCQYNLTRTRPDRGRMASCFFPAHFCLLGLLSAFFCGETRCTRRHSDKGDEGAILEAVCVAASFFRETRPEPDPVRSSAPRHNPTHTRPGRSSANPYPTRGQVTGSSALASTFVWPLPRAPRAKGWREKVGCEGKWGGRDAGTNFLFKSLVLGSSFCNPPPHPGLGPALV